MVFQFVRLGIRTFPFIFTFCGVAFYSSYNGGVIHNANSYLFLVSLLSLVIDAIAVGFLALTYACLQFATSPVRTLIGRNRLKKYLYLASANSLTMPAILLFKNNVNLWGKDLYLPLATLNKGLWFPTSGAILLVGHLRAIRQESRNSRRRISMTKVIIAAFALAGLYSLSQSSYLAGISGFMNLYRQIKDIF